MDFHDVRAAVKLMRELGLLKLKLSGIEVELDPDFMLAAAEEPEPVTKDVAKPDVDGLTPEMQEALYGRRFK